MISDWCDLRLDFNLMNQKRIVGDTPEDTPSELEGEEVICFFRWVSPADWAKLNPKHEYPEERMRNAVHISPEENYDMFGPAPQFADSLSSKEKIVASIHRMMSTCEDGDAVISAWLLCRLRVMELYSRDPMHDLPLVALEGRMSLALREVSLNL
jgi:hypothetical protein